MNTSSGRVLVAVASAPGPSWATATSWPRSARSRARVVAASTLSSTTRMRSGRVAGAIAEARSRPGPDRRVPTRRFARGRRTTISQPLPGPSLKACTDPPCILTRLRTIVRPMPMPPWARSSERVVLHEQIEGALQQLGRHPDAVVAHA